MTTSSDIPLRFHWSFPVVSQQKASDARPVGTLDIDEMISVAKKAEALGIEQLLVGVGFHTPDSFVYLATLIRETKKVKFLLAYRAGSISPTTFVQMVNTLSTFGDNRVTLNLLAGISPVEQKYYGDHLAKDERLTRLDEFIDVCQQFWLTEKPVDHKGTYYDIEQGQLHIGYNNTQRDMPETYLSGNSLDSMQCAIERKVSLLRYSDTVEKIADKIKPAVEAGVSVGLRMSTIVRETKAEVQAKIDDMMDGVDEEWAGTVAEYMKTCDSTAVHDVFNIAKEAKGDWVDDLIWTGAVRFRGGPSLALAGEPEQVADYIMQYKSVGVTDFILSGWPQPLEMEYFCTLVLPLIRAKEQALLDAH